MAGTITSGPQFPVSFTYTGTGVYQVIDIGFVPSVVIASVTTHSYIWTASMTSGTAHDLGATALQNGNGAGAHASSTTDGRGIGFFVGSSTTTNANSLTFAGIAFR